MVLIDSTLISPVDWSLLGQILVELAAGDPVERSFQRALLSCKAALGSGIVVILLPDSDDQFLTACSAAGLDADSLAPFALGTFSLQHWGEKETAALALHDPRLAPGNGICLPLLFRDTVLGLFCAIPEDRAFSAESKEFLEAVAAALSTTLATRLPHSDIMNRERLERELQFAHTLQRSFIPRSLPQLKDYRLSSYHTSSIEMGGDFHDAFLLPGNRLAMLVGSTSGTGVEAGLNIARIISELRGIIASECSPGRALTLLNTLLIRECRISILVHIGLIILEESTGNALCAAAGKTTICLLNPPRDRVTHLESGNSIPVGMIPSQNFTDMTTCLKPGGSLVIYTDGICRNENADGFVLEQSLLDTCLLEETPAGVLSAEALHEHLMDHLDAHPTAEDATIFSIDRIT